MPSPRAAEIALAAGAYTIGTGEMSIMGILPFVAVGLGVSVTEAGLAISAYALGVVIGAPLIAVFTARLPQRKVLLGLMAMYVAGHLASALAPNYASFIAFRFLAGLPHGAFFGVASLVAASLVNPSERARAVGRVMLGLNIAALFGIPLAAGLGHAISWRVAYLVVAGVGGVAVVLLWREVPDIPANRAATPLSELGAFKRRQVWLAVGMAAFGSAGMFCVFSYVVSVLTQVSHFDVRVVPYILCVYGVGMIIGNLVGARLADRSVLNAIGLVLLWNIGVLMLFPWLAPTRPGVVLGILLVGTGSALLPALQIRLMDVAAEAQTLAASLNHSAFNIANALGAWAGGVAINAGYGWASIGWAGAILVSIGFFIYLLTLVSDHRLPFPFRSAMHRAEHL